MVGTDEGKKKLQKDILSCKLAYPDFFADGFSLEQFDAKFKHLRVEEKVQLLGSLTEAIEVNLPEYCIKTHERPFKQQFNFGKKQIEVHDKSESE